MIFWLEGNKLRLHSPANRDKFTASKPDEWDKAYTAYLKQAGCPFDRSNTNECVDWLLNQAVRNDYMDNGRIRHVILIQIFRQILVETITHVPG